MQLHEVLPLVLGIVLRDAIVIAQPSPYLHELNRRELVHQTPARTFPIGYRTIRIEKLTRDLKIVSGNNEPVGLEQSGELLTLVVGDALVLGQFCLRQPRNRAGSEAAKYPGGRF